MREIYNYIEREGEGGRGRANVFVFLMHVSCVLMHYWPAEERN